MVLGSSGTILPAMRTVGGMSVALILWAVIGPSVGMVVGATFASRHPDDERSPQAEDSGR
jgi:hypothetical protein